jgi:hypothetical protein
MDIIIIIHQLQFESIKSIVYSKWCHRDFVEAQVHVWIDTEFDKIMVWCSWCAAVILTKAKL